MESEMTRMRLDLEAAAAGVNAEGTEAERRRALKRALRTLQRQVVADDQGAWECERI